MFKISPLTDKTQSQFENLFKDYYRELGCDDDCDHLLREYVLPDLMAGLIRIDVMDFDGLCGFVVYQKDDIDNDWNLKEGWGDIREIYVAPQMRKQGLGKFLLFTAEMKLRESGVNRAYALPTDDSAPFFAACGYTPSGNFNAELNCFEYVKENLDNTCKHKKV